MAYPRTAAEAKLATGGYGTFTAGWLCDEAATPLGSVFGGYNLDAVGSPSFLDLGPFNPGIVDFAVGLNSSSAKFTYDEQATSGAGVFGVSSTGDLVVVAVFKTDPSSSESPIASVISPSAPAFDAYWKLRLRSLDIRLDLKDGTDSTSSGQANVEQGKWSVAVAVIDRGADAARVAVRTLTHVADTGSVSGTLAPIGDLYSGSGRPGDLTVGPMASGSSFKLGALYIGAGTGAAAGMSTNIAAIAKNFVDYLNAVSFSQVSSRTKIRRAPGGLGAPFGLTRSTVSVPIYSPTPGTYSPPRLTRLMRGPWRPGQAWKRTDASSTVVEVVGVPAGSSFWGPMYPPPSTTFWDGMYPEAAQVPSGTIPPVAPDGVATFAPLLEAGASVTYAWATDVLKSYSGKERRVATLDSPRQEFVASIVLIDNAMLTTRTELASSAAAGAVFMLALPYESITLSADSAGTVVYVASTALCDWLIPGQRVIVVAKNGTTTYEGSIQYGDATSITLDATVGTAGLAGGTIMPLMPVYFDPQQSFARYPTHVERWEVTGRHAVFDFAAIGSITAFVAGSSAYVVGDRRTNSGKAYVCTTAGTSTAADGGPTGTGTDITVGSAHWRYFATLDSDGYVPAAGVGATVTSYASRPVFDRGLGEGASDSIQSMVELVDMGGVPLSVGEATVPDWGRSILIERKVGAEWQWLKGFMKSVRGSWKSFWLPSWRPDMTYVSRAAPAGVTILTVSGGEPAVWFPAHRTKLQLVRGDGTVTYVGITLVVDNGDGTSAVTLDVLLSAETVTVISWLELCRLESDSISVQFASTTFAAQLQARVVQQ